MHCVKQGTHSELFASETKFVMGSYILSIFIFCIQAADIALSFNIDVKHKIDEYDIGSTSSRFGYSVSLIDNKESPLVVGAPDHNGVGAIFQCGKKGGKCTKVFFTDTNGITADTKRRQTEGQKFGFSLSRIGRRIIACAPKFKVMLKTRSHGTITQPVGRCAVFDDSMRFKYSESPCEDTYLLPNQNKLLMGFGYCLAGTSTTGMPLEMYDPMFYVGTPGTRHLTGLVFSLNSDRAVKARERNRDFTTHSYIGYSISAGNIIDENKVGDVMTGAPRGNKLNGHAILYKYKNKDEFSWKTVIFNPREQLGSYFGASVCVADFNGDGRDDVLIGAPYYSTTWDEGRVYTYESKGDRTYDTSDGNGYKYKGLELEEYLDGDNKLGSRFGTTVVNVGDLDRDGYTDIAIGAPGGDEGAVYIYNGAREGLKNKYSQVIRASAVPGKPGGFGISIASGIDVDSNKYNDLAIGAHLSGKTYVFKSRAIIKLTSSQRTNVSVIPSAASKNNCAWKEVKYFCIAMEVDLTYSGEGTLGALKLDTTFSLDHEAIRKRAFMVSSNGKELVSQSKRVLKMRKEKKEQISIVIFLKMLGTEISDVVDILQPVNLLTSFQARHDPTKCADVPCGILNNNVQTASSEVVYEHKCGADDTCEPDLLSESSVLFSNNPGMNILLYGVVYDFVLMTRVVNNGEPAYQAKLRVDFSKDFNVDRVEINRKAHPLWNVELLRNKKQLKFVFANPIQQGTWFNLVVKFSVPLPKPSNNSYNFHVEVSSLGNEVNPTDNKELLEVSTKVDACLSVSGHVSPSFVSARAEESLDMKSNSTYQDKGTDVQHAFIIKNEAEVPVEGLKANINLVVAKDDVKLMCMFDVTINGKPCDVIPMEIMCRKSGRNMIGSIMSVNEQKLNKALRRSFNCGNAKCVTLSCPVDKLNGKKNTLVLINSRLLDSSFSDVYQTVLESTISVNLNESPQSLFLYRKECKTTAEVMLNVEVLTKEKRDVPKEVPLWIYIVSILGAILLLVLIVLLMYKLGFFARKRPGEEEVENDALTGVEDEEEEE